jgi:rhomboid protease GluP
VIFVVAVGGGSGLDPVLRVVDREAPDAARLSLFHLGDDRSLRRIGGRRSPVLERAARALAAQRPVALTEVPELIARGRRERDEAARFARELQGRFAPATVLLVGACVVLYLLGAVWSGRPFLQALRDGPQDVLGRMGANLGDLVRRGELWRLLASTFLHGNIYHLLFNMVALQSFGGFMEAVLGWRRYLALYTAAGLGGAIASAFLHHHGFSVGASGAIWGLMLAGFALARAGTALPVRIAQTMRQRLKVVLVLNVALSFLPGIDLYAHFGGGLVGFALVRSGALVGARPDSRTVRVLAWACAAALAVSVAIALAAGRP